MGMEYAPADNVEVGAGGALDAAYPAMLPDDDEPKGPTFTEVSAPAAPAPKQEAPTVEYQAYDDTPEADKGRPTEINPKAKTYVSAEKLAGLPPEVGKRFAELNAHAQIHRRKAEQEQREREAAEQINLILAAKVEKLQQDLHEASKMGVGFANQKAQSDVDRAQGRVAELGKRQQAGEDVAAELAKAHADLGKAAAEAEMMRAIPMSDRPQIDPDVVQIREHTAQRQQQREQASKQTQYAPPQPDEPTRLWMESNPWFANINHVKAGNLQVNQVFHSMEDAVAADAMSQAAVVEEQRIRAANGGVPDYAALDEFLRKTYPVFYSRVSGEHPVQQPQSGRNTQPKSAAPPQAPQQQFTRTPPVSGVTRVGAATNGNRIVQVPQRIVDRCKRLGISVQEFMENTRPGEI